MSDFEKVPTFCVDDREFNLESLQLLSSFLCEFSDMEHASEVIRTIAAVYERTGSLDAMLALVPIAERAWDMMRETVIDSLEATRWNAAHPVGTAVQYFDEPAGCSYLGRIASPAMESKFGVRVLISHCESSIPVSDVQRVSATTEAALRREGC